MPNGWGMAFPAFLTHTAAIDTTIIDLMRTVMNKDYQCEGLSDLLLELHAKEHHCQAIRYNYEFILAADNPMSRSQTHIGDDIFSLFDDLGKYNDQDPTCGYLSEARKQHHETIHLLTR